MKMMKVAEQFDMDVVKEKAADFRKNRKGFKRVTKKPTDENAPKKPLSAYFSWAKAARSELVKKEPDLSIGELGKKLGEQWNELSEEDKATFIGQFHKLQKVYIKEFEKYKKTANYKKHQTTMHAWKVHLTFKPYRKDENAPTRPLTAYVLYSKSMREQVIEDNPDLKHTEIMVECGKLWGELDDDERKKWSKEAAALREVYVQELEKYRKTKKYKKYQAELEEYKAKNNEKRRKLLGIRKKKKKEKKRARDEESDGDSDAPKKKKKKKSSKSKRSGSKSRRPKSKKKDKAKSKQKKSKKVSRSRSRSTSRSPSSSSSRRKSKKSKKSKSKNKSKKSRKKGKKKKN